MLVKALHNVAGIFPSAVGTLEKLLHVSEENGRYRDHLITHAFELSNSVTLKSFGVCVWHMCYGILVFIGQKIEHIGSLDHVFERFFVHFHGVFDLKPAGLALGPEPESAIVVLCVGVGLNVVDDYLCLSIVFFVAHCNDSQERQRLKKQAALPRRI